MTSLRIRRMQMSIAELLHLNRQLLLDPEYQREGQIWTRERQQLLIDSVLNGLDVPPLYLHQLSPPQFIDDRAVAYAVVDGRQRLEAFVGFADGLFPLASDFRLLEEDAALEGQFDLGPEAPALPSRFAGYLCADLKQEGASLYYRFMEYAVPVTVIETEDQAHIEELFFRLNEGVPLTPAEKRTRGELLRELVLPLVSDQNIFQAARFRGRRRSNEDLLLRLLFMVSNGSSLDRVNDLKKKAIDDFAASFRPRFGEQWTVTQRGEARDRLSALVGRVAPVAATINDTFDEKDVLLSSVTSYIVHFLVFMKLGDDGAELPSRQVFADFAAALASLKGQPEESLSEDQVDALEYTQPIQGSTTGSYYQRRAEILYRYVMGNLVI